jgi:hypothetical protein
MKGGKTMNYSKPEFAILGDASSVIQGDKVVPGENLEIGAPRHFELED